MHREAQGYTKAGPGPSPAQETILRPRVGASGPTWGWSGGQTKPRSQVSGQMAGRPTRSEGKEQRTDQGKERSWTYWADAQE